MAVEVLEFHYFRNIQQAKLEPSPDINIIFGNNGEGKTSLLEAIYYLSLGRSFRSRLISRLIQHGQAQFTLFAKIDARAIGIAKGQDGESQIKIEGDVVKSATELTNLLPVQLINPDTYRLLNEGPKFRREFIDWGVFHVEPNFIKTWQEMQRSLKQRNLALKMKAPAEEIQLWDPVFSKASESLDACRESYIKAFEPMFRDILSKLIEIKGLTIVYRRGWPKNDTLEDLLSSALKNDLRLSHTSYGPHRAELDMLIEGVPAKDVLSRGQQKLFVYAMRITQGLLLQKQTGKACTYLIDDLPAELDAGKRNAILEMLLSFNLQIFVTAVELKPLEFLLQHNDFKVFHVEQGALSEQTPIV